MKQRDLPCCCVPSFALRGNTRRVFTAPCGHRFVISEEQFVGAAFCLTVAAEIHDKTKSEGGKQHGTTRTNTLAS